MAGRSRRYARGAACGVAVIAGVIGAVHEFQVVIRPAMGPSIAGGRSTPCTSGPQTAGCVASTPTASLQDTSSPYRDGTYSAQGAYLTPGGSEAIGVHLTIYGGRVVRSRIVVEALSPTARQFQRQFASQSGVQVVSRDLASLNVSRVAGASLTSLGFDNALAEIRSAAHDRA